MEHEPRKHDRMSLNYNSARAGCGFVECIVKPIKTLGGGVNCKWCFNSFQLSPNYLECVLLVFYIDCNEGPGWYHGFKLQWCW